MKQIDYLVLGGGIAGTTAAEEIRSKDPNSSVTIITEEANRLYSRVQLPHYLRDEHPLQTVFVRTPESYVQKNIELKTSTKVTKIDTVNKIVKTDSGEDWVFKKLLVATGGKVNTLHLPGSELTEVVYLRTLENAQRVKELMAQSHDAVVIGGGFIGIEFAQSFIKHNLKTTAIVREKSFWESVVGENSAILLSQILTHYGVNILPESEVSHFLGEGKLQGVGLKNGSEVKADIAGVGIGIHMELSHLQDSGLRINKGVLTNEYLETSEPNIWAAGDIAEFFDPIQNKHHQLGNWANSSSQGRIVGLNMIGQKTVFETNSLYSISVFGVNFSFLGNALADENTEIIERGSVMDGKIARLLLVDDVIVGASLINMPIDRNHLNNLIKNRTKITSAKAQLSNLSFELSTIS